MATIELTVRDDLRLLPKQKYQADIWVDERNDYHGIGHTPAEALFNAALCWRATELVQK